jgi:hypothetical protein
MLKPLDFVEVYANQIIWRRVFLLLSALFFIGMCFFLALWFFSPPPKETSDYLREYVYSRYNYDYNTVEKAYFNKLQYMPLAYENIINAEINEVKQGKIISYFRVDKIVPKQNNLYEVNGRRLMVSIASGSANVISDEDKVIYIGVKGRKFYETDIQEKSS